MSALGYWPVSTSKVSSAVLKVEIWVTACCSRACSVRPENFGMTMAARIPRMTSTSSSSTKVKARAGVEQRILIFIVKSKMGLESFDVVLKREDRQHHADKNRPD